MLPFIFITFGTKFLEHTMRSFASDNNSGVHPLIMDAIIKANDNHAVGYGDDPWTAAATNKIKEVFGETASPFFVFNLVSKIS